MMRLQESFSISGADYSRIDTLQESSTKIYEDVDGKKFECVAAYRVPISRYNWKNENGRVYSKDLWENVVKNQKHIWEGSIGLADHPVEEGSVKDTFAVYHNLGLNEKTGTVDVDIHLVGTHGKLAFDIMEAGGKIGFSSSGFGELLEDGCTVDPKTYMLERVSDFVLNPSQKVFGTRDMKIGVVNVKKNESKEIVSMNESTIPAGRKISKLEERKFRKDVEGFLQEASSVEKPSDRLVELNELLTYFEEDTASDLKERVTAEIENTKKLLETVQTEQLKLKEAFGVDTVEDLKEGVSKIVADTQLFERQSNDWKKIAEGLQIKIRELQDEIDELPTGEDLELSENKFQRMKKFIAQREQLMRNKTEALRRNLETSTRRMDRMSANIEKYESKLEEYKTTIIDGAKVIAGLENRLAEKTTSVQKLLAEKNSLKESYERLPEIHPTYTEKAQPYLDLTETRKVQSYCRDLIERHGNKILPFKNKILNCKTLNEAMKLYVGILAEMDNPRIADGIVDNRQALVEKTTGRKIEDRGSKLPKGWV